MQRTNLTRSLITATVLASAIVPGAMAATTSIEQVVMYYIEDDDHVLYRYVFDTNTVTPIGPIKDQFGATLEDNEAMSYIPSGPNQGLYTSCNSTAPSSKYRRLVKINALDGACTLYPDPVIGYIRGSTPFKDGAGNWMIYGAQSSGGGTICKLVVINPADGHLVGAPIDVKNAASAYVVMEGLALNAAGELFGVEHAMDGAGKRSQLFSINRTTGLATPVGGRTPWKRIESLEFAVGNATPDIAGLPAPADTWDASKGVLFGFSDNDNAFVILNAASGATVNFSTINGDPLAFTPKDVECMVFVTQSTDGAGNMANNFD